MAKGGCGVTGLLMFLIVIVLVLIGVVGFLYFKDSWVANRISQIDTSKFKSAADKTKKTYEDVSPYAKKAGSAIKEQASKIPVTNMTKALSAKAREMMLEEETNSQVSTKPVAVKKTTNVKTVSTTKKPPATTQETKKAVTQKKTTTSSTKTTSASKTVAPSKPKIPTASKTPTTAAKSATTTASQPVSKNVKVYLTKYVEAEDAFTLVPVTRISSRSGTPLEDTLKTLLQGTTQEEDSKDLTSAIPGGVILKRVVVSNGIAKIDYNAQLETGSGKALMHARIYQIVYTATEFSTVKSVLIRVDGKSPSNFAGQGLDLRTPLARIGSSPRFKN